MGKLLNIVSALMGALAVFIGLLFSPVPRSLGFYRWYATHNPQYVGMTPAFMLDREWGYTFEELYSNDLTGHNAIVTGANSGACPRLLPDVFVASVLCTMSNNKHCIDSAESHLQM